MTITCKKCGLGLKGSISLSDHLERRTTLCCQWCNTYYCSDCSSSDVDCPESGCDGVVTEESNVKSMLIFAGGPRFRNRIERDSR